MDKKPTTNNDSGMSKDINHWKPKILSFLSMLIFCIPFFLIAFYTQGGPTQYITADSLLTASTVTLIAFTNFAPGSSPSGAVIKRAYWRSTRLTSDADRSHKILWLIFGCWATPIMIIIFSGFITIIEVTISPYLSGQYSNMMLIPLSMTFFLLVTALIRFVIFHTYQNKNTSNWISYYLFKKVKNNSSNRSKSKYLHLLSYFRITSNFELVHNIIRTMARKADQIDKIEKKDIEEFIEKGPLRPAINQKSLILVFYSNIYSNDYILEGPRKKAVVADSLKLFKQSASNDKQQITDTIRLLSMLETYWKAVKVKKPQFTKTLDRINNEIVQINKKMPKKGKELAFPEFDINWNA